MYAPSIADAGGGCARVQPAGASCRRCRWRQAASRGQCRAGRGSPKAAAAGVTPPKCQRRAGTARHGPRRQGADCCPHRRAGAGPRRRGVMARRAARPPQHKSQRCFAAPSRCDVCRSPPAARGCAKRTAEDTHPPPRRGYCPPPTRGGGTPAIRPHATPATPIAGTTPVHPTSGGHFTAKKRGPPSS